MYCLRKVGFLSSFVLTLATLLIFISTAYSQENNDPLGNNGTQWENDLETGSSEENLSQSKGIVNGQVDHGHPAVGIVDWGCTGTLIGTNTVLTAAHCVENNADVEFILDDYVYRGTAFTHPTYRAENWNDYWYFDLAIIRVEEIREIRPDVPEPPDPIPLCKNLSYPTNWPITIVGFGLTATGADDFGVKRWATTYIQAADVDISYMSSGLDGGSTHFGDSGGPALITDGDPSTPECVIGALSKFYKSTGLSYHTRPEAFSDWIETTAISYDPSIEWVDGLSFQKEVCDNDPDHSTCHHSTWGCYWDDGEGGPEYYKCGWRRPNNQGPECEPSPCP